MQVRFSTCRGTPVIAQALGDMVGSLDGILLNPDTGKAEGFFVAVPGFFQSKEVFLAAADIRRWGRAVEVLDADILGPLDEHVRFERLLREKRPILGMPVRTESGLRLGRCADVQFDTETFQLQWLFPRRYRLLWGIPIPAHAVCEVRREAVIVKDRVLPAKEEKVSPVDIVVSPTAA